MKGNIVIKIFIGSGSDYAVVRKAYDVEKFFFDKPTIDIRVASAHRTPFRVRDLVEEAIADGAKVFIACAGGAAHLAGVIAAHTVLPVIGVPIRTELSGGLDSLLSTAQMPSGVPVATVAVNAIENAVILAVQILACSNADLSHRLHEYKAMLVSKVVEADRDIRRERV